MNEDIYKLYKQVMKKQPNAISNIETLEDAKLIISMMIGNVYLNSDMYRTINKYKKGE